MFYRVRFVLDFATLAQFLSLFIKLSCWLSRRYETFNESKCILAVHTAYIRELRHKSRKIFVDFELFQHKTFHVSSIKRQKRTKVSKGTLTELMKFAGKTTG